MKVNKNQIKSRVTWDDVIEKIDLDSTSKSIHPLIFIISNQKSSALPTLQLRHGENSSFPGGLKEAFDELKPERMDVYVSFSKISELFPMHTDRVDVIIAQMVGNISYEFSDGSIHTLEPGDTILIPKGVPHRAILHGPRITLSCS